MPTRTLPVGNVALFSAAVSLLGFALSSLDAQDRAPSAPLPPGAVARLGQANLWHGIAIRALAFSPDESLVASMDADNQICLWDTATGHLRLRVESPRQPVDDRPNRVLLTTQGPVLQFSGDGKNVAVADPLGRVCRIWDIATGKPMPPIHLSFAEDNLNIPAGAVPPAGLVMPTRGVAGVFALAHDASQLAMAQTTSHAIHLHTPGQKEPLHKLTDHTARIQALAYSPDGTILASAGDDQTIRFWDLKQGKLIRTLTSHRAAVVQLAFSQTSDRLLSASSDGSLRLWDVATGQVRTKSFWKPTRLLDDTNEPGFATTRSVNSIVHQVWFDADGRRFGAFYTVAFGTTGVCEDVAARFDAATGKVLGRQIVHDQRTSAATGFASSALTTSKSVANRSSVAALAPRRNLLARAAAARIQLLAMETGLPATPGLHAACTDIAIAGDEVAVIQQGDPSIYLWNPKAGAALRKLEGHTGQPFLIGFADRGQCLISASHDQADRNLSVWDIHRAAELRQIPGWNPGGGTNMTPTFASRTASIAAAPVAQLSPDGKRLALRGNHGRLRVVDLATGADVAPYAVSWKGDGCVAFTADGRRLVVSDSTEVRKVPGGVKAAAGKGGFGGGGGRFQSETSCHLRLIDVATGAEIGLLNEASHDFHIVRLLVAGRYALANCKDGALRAIDLETGTAVREVMQSKNNVTSPAGAFATLVRPTLFALSADGRMMAVRSSETGAWRILEVASGKSRHTLSPSGQNVTCVAFAADSLHLVTGAQDSSVLVWSLGATPGQPFPDAAWQDLGHDDAGRAFQTMRHLLSHPAATIELIRANLKPAVTPDEAVVRQKIRELDSSSFATRQKAQDELILLGDPIRNVLDQAAAARDVSSEMKQRLGTILKRLDVSAPSGDRIRESRAIELLERIGSKEARALLEHFAAGAQRAALTHEAIAALHRLPG